MLSKLIDAGSIAGLIFSWPMIVMCIVVAWLYGQAAVDAIRTHRRARIHAQWLALGIVIAYHGEWLDDLYWFVTWSLDFVGATVAPKWIQFGPIPNVPFRNILGCTGVYCHIRAVLVGEDHRVSELHWLVVASTLAGCIYVGLLTYLR